VSTPLPTDRAPTAGRDISNPVWFVREGEKLYLLPVGGSDSVTLTGAAGAFRRFEKRQCEAAQTARRSRSDVELVDRRPRLPGSGWPVPGDDDDGIPRTSRIVRYQGNAASRAHPAGGRRKLPPMAGNLRNTKSGTPC
jgi:hypothetical protein